MFSSASGLAPGTRIDKFEIERPLGEGGFGAVYRARHSLLGYPVALKLLHPEHATSAEIIERFAREARATTTIGSPHIVQTVDCGTSEDGWLFLAMELLEGQSLEKVLQARDEPFAVERAVDIGVQTLEGLAAAHGAGVIHRDLKPANIFLVGEPTTGRELVKLLDFGVSKITTVAQQTALTQTGAMLGTPLYMAPEQFHNARDVDARVDLYSAASVMYLMLAGRAPYLANTYAELVVQICCEPPPSLDAIAPRVPRLLASVVMKGLTRDPEDRWPDAMTFAGALRQAQQSGVAPTPGSQPSRPAQITLPATKIPPVAGDLPSARPSSQGGGDARQSTGAGASGSSGAFLPPTFQTTDIPAQTPAEPFLPPTFQTTDAPAQPPEPQKPRSKLRGLALVAGGMIAVMLVAGVVGGVVWAALEMRDEPSSPTPSPPPQTPPPPPPRPAQETETNDPLGDLFTTVVGSMGEGMAGPSSTSVIPGDPSTGVQIHEPRLVGQLDREEVRRALRASQSAMAGCRQPNGPTRVSIQIHVNLNQVLIAAPASTNSGPRDVAQCCADSFSRSIPANWSPGVSGMIFTDVALQPR